MAGFFALKFEQRPCLVTPKPLLTWRQEAGTDNHGSGQVVTSG